MYHTCSIDIHKKDVLYPCLDRACSYACSMYNVANFYIRNLMTGLKKAPGTATPNEVFVMDTVRDAVDGVNRKFHDRYEAGAKAVMEDEGLSEQERLEKLSALKYRPFEMPTAEKWFAGYGLLDAVFRHTGNPDYRAYHAHVMQNAVKDCCKAWASYFGALKAYSSGGAGFTGRPRIPRYKKSGGRAAAVFSNTACTIRGGDLLFPIERKEMPDGSIKKVRPSIRVSALPRFGEKLVEVRAVPCYGSYRLQLVTDDGIPEEGLTPGEGDIVRPGEGPAGVMTMDLGLDNFAAIADNRGGMPIVVKGGEIKARNQWFNKRMARLRSDLMKGHDPKRYRPPATKQMEALSRKREAFLRDTFYKYAHYICRLAVERGISFIIAGHNEGQKQGISLGRKTDQVFVQVPFARFLLILRSTALNYGIRVILQEESYTSKACFMERDPMPVYGQEGIKKPVFSGKRVKRGLYRQPDGRLINADINGSANIGRKYDGHIFPEGQDYGYLCGTVKAMRYKGILEESHRYHRQGAS